MRSCQLKSRANASTLYGIVCDERHVHILVRLMLGTLWCRFGTPAACEKGHADALRLNLEIGNHEEEDE